MIGIKARTVPTMTTPAVDRWSTNATPLGSETDKMPPLVPIGRGGAGGGGGQRRTIFRSSGNGGGGGGGGCEGDEADDVPSSVPVSPFNERPPRRNKTSILGSFTNRNISLVKRKVKDKDPPPTEERQSGPDRIPEESPDDGGVRRSSSASNLADLRGAKGPSPSSPSPDAPRRKSLKSCLSVGSNLSSLGAGGEDPAGRRSGCVTANAKMKKSVSFNRIEIREHPRTLGDNPAATSGPALSLDWYREEGDGPCRTFQLGFEEYEAFKGDRACGGRDKRQFWIPRAERELILRQEAGVTSSEMYRAQREAARIRHSRQACKRGGMDKFFSCSEDGDGENGSDGTGKKQQQRGPRQRHHRRCSAEKRREEDNDDNGHDDLQEVELLHLLDQTEVARQQEEGMQHGGEQAEQPQPQQRDPREATAAGVPSTGEAEGRMSFMPPPPNSSTSEDIEDGVLEF